MSDICMPLATGRGIPDWHLPSWCPGWTKIYDVVELGCQSEVSPHAEVKAKPVLVPQVLGTAMLTRTQQGCGSLVGENPEGGADSPAAVCRKQGFSFAENGENDEVAFYPPKEHFAHLTPENNENGGWHSAKKKTWFTKSGVNLQP